MTAATLEGLSVSPGQAMARAFILRPDPLDAAAHPDAGLAGSESVQAGTLRFTAAVALAARQLRELAERVRPGLGDDKAAIFEADLVFLDDQEFLDEVLSRIRAGAFAPAAALETCEAHARAIEKLPDAYLRERAADIRGLGRRLAANCLGLAPEAAMPPEGEIVVVARDLSAAEVALLDPEQVAAIVTEAGGAASHAAILAASLGIPAVVRAAGALSLIRDGDTLLVDAGSGRITVNPPPEIAAKFAAGLVPEDEGSPREASPQPALTLDGEQVALLANIGSAGEAERAAARGAEGVGLFRLEFMYLGRNQPPSEEELTQAIAAALAAMDGRTVDVRILDAGADKDLPYLELPRTDNPALGPRGVRLAASWPGIFLPELSAVLRAGVSGRARLLLPMVTEVSEVRRFRQLLAQAAAALDGQGIARADGIPVGVMIETPAAVFLAGQLAREADFFSIGANDLTQYVLAADRGDESVAELYDFYNPAVLAAIKVTVSAADAAEIPVSVCGEMAGEVHGALLLIGLGIRGLSMSPGRIPAVRAAIRSHRLDDLTALAVKALTLESAAEVRQALRGLDA
jgi:phosphoenolpyruvate-protein phosphotransferase